MSWCKESTPHDRLLATLAIGRGAVGEDMARVGIVHTEIVIHSLLFFGDGGFALSIDKGVSLFGGRALSGIGLEGGAVHWGKTSSGIGWVCSSGGGSKLSHHDTDGPLFGLTAPNLVVDCH
jgi:hypothetical protein